MGPASLNLRLRADFLSTTELSFLRAVELATRGRFSVLPKVNLGDLFFSPTGDVGDWNRINRKHVDFVLCDAETLKPVLGIELDDSSHSGARATKRDAVKDAAFASAGLPLLRLPASRSYATKDVSAAIEAAITAHTAETSPQAASAERAGAPLCPSCGVAMVIRPGIKGRYDSFYGCTNYPRCRERKLIPSE